MLSYCLKCRKNTESKNPNVLCIKNRRIMLLSKYSVCNTKKFKLFLKKEARGLLSSLGIKTPLAQIPFLVFRSSFVLKV